MSQIEKVLDQVLHGSSDNNVEFSDIVKLIEKLGFQTRTKGSHHIFSMVGIEEIVNLQPRGSKAKAYQVRQIRNIILKYKLAERVK